MALISWLGFSKTNAAGPVSINLPTPSTIQEIARSSAMRFA
jgi:hypothetical protein